MDVILEKIEANLASCNDLESDIQQASDSPQVQQQLAWIERQLSGLVGKLQAMLLDLDSGLSIAEMGFFDSEELQDFLQDLATQIAQLKSIAQTLSKGLGQAL